jgi:CRP/FNR family cyclic AMP-dependent transcriptional regulator
MDDLDFVSLPLMSAKASGIPPKIFNASNHKVPKYYDPELALKFFKIAGSSEEFSAGEKVFAEGDKYTGLFSRGANAFYLIDGQVALTRAGKPLSLILPGETFGEMAIISKAPRSADAVARKQCRVLSLDEKRFLASLREFPDFALMLLGLIAERLQHAVERTIAIGKGPIPPRENSFALEQKQLDTLQNSIGDFATRNMESGEVIVKQGALGQFMFVVTSGTVSIAINDVVIERIGAGSTFGELGLMGNGIRAATAIAESNGRWIAVTREQFLATVQNSPAIGLALLRAMGERLQHVNQVLGS